MYLGLGGQREVLVSQPSLKIDDLGDTMSFTRRLDRDSLDPGVRYRLRSGQLFRPVEGSRGMTSVGAIRGPPSEICLKKVEHYTKEFWKKLHLGVEGTGVEASQEFQYPVGRTSWRRCIRRCPGLRRVRGWLKALQNSANSSSESETGGEEDICREDHSEGEFSFKQDREERRALDQEGFARAVRYAFAMTFGRAGRVYREPAVVFRMYLSRYLHSDKERKWASRVLFAEKPGPTKSFAKTAKAFLRALREGNAINSSKKDFVTVCQGVKPPEEILKLEEKQQPKTELRTGNLQECIQIWTAPPAFRSLSNGKSLIDSPDDESSVDNEDQEIPLKHSFEEEINLKKRYHMKVLSIKKWPKKYGEQTKELNYLQNLDVSLKGEELILLCILNRPHLLGKLSFESIMTLIESAEKHVQGNRELKGPHRKLINEGIPLIHELCEKMDRIEKRGQVGSDRLDMSEDWLAGLLEEADPFEARPGGQEATEYSFQPSSTYEGSLRETKISGEDDVGRGEEASEEWDVEAMFTEEDVTRETTHCSSDSFSTFGPKPAYKKFSISRLRKYNLTKNKNKLSKNIVKYNKKFNLLIKEHNKKVYTLPRFYKFGQWTKYSEEEMEKFLESQNLIDKKCEYIIQHGSYVLKGQEKVIKKCLAALKNLGIKTKNLKFALLLYSMLVLRDELDIYGEENELKEKFKMLNELRMGYWQLNHLEENIKACANTSRESWLADDKDYQMKMFVSGNKKTKKHYESFFNLRFKINKDGQNTNDNLEKYNHYNYKTDINFDESNDYSSEEGDANENHYLDNLCSCGVVKEEFGMKNHSSKLGETHVQIEYHHKSEDPDTTDGGYSSPDDIKITTFKKIRGQARPHSPPPPIEMISRESMLNLHSVFNHGFDNFNRDQVLKVVEFVKELGEGKKAELVFDQTKEEFPEDFKRTSDSESHSKQQKSFKSESILKVDKNSKDEIDKYLHTEVYQQEEMPDERVLLTSDQDLPIKYLERVFHHVQQFSI